VKFPIKARWLVVLKNDKIYVTDDEVTVTELSLRLAKRGVDWQEICVVLKMPLSRFNIATEQTLKVLSDECEKGNGGRRAE